MFLVLIGWFSFYGKRLIKSDTASNEKKGRFLDQPPLMRFILLSSCTYFLVGLPTGGASSVWWAVDWTTCRHG